MATTVPDGIWSPDDSTAYNPTIDLAAMADTIQDGLNNVRSERADFNQQFYGPAAARVGLTGVKPGDTYQETDAGKLTWRQNTAGLWRVFNTNGTIALTLNSGWTALTPATYEVRGGVIFFNGRLSATSGAGETMFSLPVDYAPAAERIEVAYDTTTAKEIIIGTNGAVILYGKGASSVGDLSTATISPFPIK